MIDWRNLDYRDSDLVKTQKLGLTIEGVERKEVYSCEEVFSGDATPVEVAIERLSQYAGRAGALVKMVDEGWERGDDIHFYVSWPMLETDEEVARRVLHAFLKEQREREKLKELKAKYEEGAD